MALAIRKAPTAFSLQPTGKNSKPVKDKPYLEWLHELPCIVTGKTPVEAAHISYAAPEYGKLGRGKSQKESDRWAVPLHAEQHRRQHSMNEREYWQSVGINPCIVALSLHAICPDTQRALLIINSLRRPDLTPRGELDQPGYGEDRD